jgi:hypothetical protein
MGTDHLTAPGWLHQMSPTLQTGIISAVHPFPCRSPHGFTMNVMVQGGASGSPVFSPETGEVLGLVYAGLFDFEMQQQNSMLRFPTNYTYALPSHYIAHSIKSIRQNKMFDEFQSRMKPLQTIFEERTAINALNGERMTRPNLPWTKSDAKL